MPKDNNQTPIIPTVTNNNDQPPIFVEETLPPMPTPKGTSVPSGTAPQQNDKQETIIPAIVTSKTKKVGSNGKIIATILGIFLLIGGVGAGVLLVNQNQNINEMAGNFNCDESNYGSVCQNNTQNTWNGKCALYYCPNGIYEAGKCDDNDPGVQLSKGPCNEKIAEANNLPKKCWQIDAVTNSGTYCNVAGCDSETIETSDPNECPVVTPPPGGTTPTASCSDVKVYTEDWTLISQTDLPNLRPATSINLCVYGTTNVGSFDRARFTINGTTLPETTTRGPILAEDFCSLYTIPADITTFNITAEIHHTTEGWK